MAAPLKCLSINGRRLGPLYVQVRFKFNTKKDKRWATKMPRRIFDVVTEPILPELPRYAPQLCQPSPKEVAPDEDNPYEEFLIRQQKKLLEESEMIIVCQVLPCHPMRYRKIQIPLEKVGARTSICNNRHARKNIAGTKLEAMKPWLQYRCILITCPEVRVKEVMKVDKQFPELLILGGFVSDRLVRRHELQRIADLPAVDTLLGDFAYGLNKARGGKTVSLLGAPQQTLSGNLGQLVKQSQEGSDDVTHTSGEEAKQS